MATASPPPPPTVNLWIVLTESKRIINAHSRHFLALSVLFLLPLCFSVTVYPSVSRLIIDQSSSSHNSVSLLRSTLHDGGSDDVDAKTVLLLLTAYISVVTVFNLLAIGSIAYSVYQGFYGRPVKLVSAVRSSFSSFLPLLATLIATNLIVLSIFLILGFAAFLISNLIKFDYTSPLVIFISLAIVTKLYSKWILAWVVVVVESSWGLTPLKRSKGLIKGMESVSMSMILVFAVAQACFVWVSTVAASMDDDGKMWTKAFFVVQIVVTSAVLTVLMLYNVAATTVLYMYCKAVRGELVWEIAEEFAREYVSLPFDDGKVPHLVSVAYDNNVC
ncbi:Transmembrane protein [Hirschfeldia incana]|nr:Transmembrane protein [Hirschfeldia incana]